MHVRFSAPFLYTPTEDRRVSTQYEAGYEGIVRRECGEAAVAAGVAEEIAAPARDEAVPGKPGKG